MIEVLSSNPAITAIGWALVQFAWQGTVVAATTAIVLLLLSRTDARIRYAIACMAMVVMVALPIQTGVRTYVDNTATSTTISAAPAARSVIGAASVPIAPVFASGTSNRPETRSGWWTSIDLQALLPIIALAWALGVVTLSIRTAGGWFLVGRIRRGGRRIGGDIARQIHQVSQMLGIHHTVHAVESAAVRVPAVVGWLRPVILIPISAMAGLSPEQFQAVIAHELAHVRRRDYLINIFQTGVETLLFYHPGVWWLSGRIRTEREHCADDVAVKVCGDAVLYAGALEMLDSRRAATGMAIGATGGSLLQRIERLMGQPRRRTPRTGAAWLTVPATLGVIAVIGIGTVPAPAVATPAPPLPPAPPAIVLQQAELPVVRESQATPEPALEPAIEVGQAEPAPDLQRPFSADAQDPIPVSPEPFRAVQPEPIPVSPAPAIVSPQAIPVTPAPPRVGTLARVLQDPIRLVTQRPGAATIPQTRVITSGQNGVYSLGGQIDGWLGLQLEDGSDRGAEVLSVVPDSPAATAGIQTGDLITGFNGTAVLGARQLARLTSETPAGRTVPLTIVRSGQEQTVEVTVGEPSTNFGWIGNDGVLVSSSAGNQFHSLEENEYFHLWNGYTDVIFPGSAGTLGVEVRTMSAELRAFFGAGPDEGILVESVQPDSIAADAGVRVGDVIVAIDGNRVDSANDLRGLTRAVLATGNAVTMTVVRDERRQDLVIEPEED